MLVSLLDYGAGNVRSVRNAIHALGYEIVDIKTPEDIANASSIVFPGVGRFGECMRFLKENNLEKPLREYVLADRPFFGICVGFQVLFESSEESPGVDGLGLIAGSVTRFESNENLPVPHMGWSTLQLHKRPTPTCCGNDMSIFDQRVYFVHSFCPLATAANSDWTLTTTDYGRRFISSVQRGRIMGTQFHPEKSGTAGLNILKSFLRGASGTATPTAPTASASASASAPLAAALATTTSKSSSSAVRAIHPPPPLTTSNVALAKRIVACLDVRSNDEGDLVVTKGDQYDVREESQETTGETEKPGNTTAISSSPKKKQKVSSPSSSSSSTTSNNSGRVRNLGKPRDLAKRYYEDGADEIVFLNITSFRSSPMSDQPLLNLLQETSKTVFVPLTIGGGIRDYTDTGGQTWTALDVASQYFRAGADKVSIGSDAVHAAAALLASNGQKTGTTSIEQISQQYGAQAVVVSVDPRRSFLLTEQEKKNHVAMGHAVFDAPEESPGKFMWYECTTRGGREGSNVCAVQLGRAVEALGAGELLCNCVDADGQKKGFELPLLSALSAAVSIPVIASSGAGTPQHFEEVFNHTAVTAALAAGIFHRNEVPLNKVKDYLDKCDGFAIRKMND